MRQKERALTLSSPSMEPRAASLSPREERARAGGAVKEDIGCEAKEFACKIYSPRTLKEVAIENPNDADQAAEIVLSELHTDLILPLPWKSWKFKNKTKTRQKFKTEIEYLLLKLGTWQFSNKQVIGRNFDSNSNWKWFYSRTCSCIFIVNKKRRYERACCKF